MEKNISWDVLKRTSTAQLLASPTDFCHQTFNSDCSVAWRCAHDASASVAVHLRAVKRSFQFTYAPNPVRIQTLYSRAWRVVGSSCRSVTRFILALLHSIPVGLRYLSLMLVFTPWVLNHGFYIPFRFLRRVTACKVLFLCCCMY